MDVDWIGTYVDQISRLPNARSQPTKLVSSAINSRGVKEDQVIINAVIKRGKNSEFKMLVKHDGHFHILHDCVLPGGSCKCFGFTHSRRHTPKSLFVAITKECWHNILKYHLLNGGRQIVYLKIGETDYAPEISIRHKIVRYGENQEGETPDGQRFMEICHNENQILRRITNSGEYSEDVTLHEPEMFNGEDDSPVKRHKRRRNWRTDEEEEQKEIERVMLEICAAPITDCFRTSTWTDPSCDLRAIGASNANLKIVQEMLKIRFANFSLLELKKFYESRIVTPHWAAVSLEKFYETYHKRDDSFNFLIKLFVFQLTAGKHVVNNKLSKDRHLWEPILYAFLKKIILHLDRKNGKENALYYLSHKSNCCKSAWINCIKDYLLNCAEMYNVNKFKSFPMQNTPNKRLIVWNEPNFESSAIMELKKVLAGDPFSADVKYSSAQDVKHTPVILSSNVDVLKDYKEHFECRVHYIIWQEVPFIDKNNTKKLHPMAFQDLIEATENYYEDNII